MRALQASCLHIIVSESGSRFIAHCLDFDLLATADTYHEALRKLNFVVAAHCHTAKKQGLSIALEHKAPEQYWRKFEHLATDTFVRSRW